MLLSATKIIFSAESICSECLILRGTWHDENVASSASCTI